MFLQPWKSCPEIDDSSAGCPATTSEVSILALSFIIMLAGLVLFVIAAAKTPTIYSAGPHKYLR